MQLDPAAAAAGFRLMAYEMLASTNTEAMEFARRGQSVPLWITAQQQLAGRGRRGNEWISAPGNLFATLLLIDPAPPERAPELSFVAALAVHDAIIAGAGGDVPGTLALKWPNDVVYDGAKLAGILIEGERVPTGLAVVIGIGVNCMQHPALTARPATDLAAAGVGISAESLFRALSDTMARRLSQWRRGAGFSDIRAAWLDRAAGFGGEMLVRLPAGEFTGRAEGLDERGRLTLRLADGTLRTVTAGDVFPLPAAEQGVDPGRQRSD